MQLRKKDNMGWKKLAFVGLLFFYCGEPKTESKQAKEMLQSLSSFKCVASKESRHKMCLCCKTVSNACYDGNSTSFTFTSCIIAEQFGLRIYKE